MPMHACSTKKWPSENHFLESTSPLILQWKCRGGSICPYINRLHQHYDPQTATDCWSDFLPTLTSWTWSKLPLAPLANFLHFLRPLSSTQEWWSMKRGGNALEHFFFGLNIYICTCKKSGAKYTNWSDRNETVIKLLRKRSPKFSNEKKNASKEVGGDPLLPRDRGGFPKHGCILGVNKCQKY